MTLEPISATEAEPLLLRAVTGKAGSDSGVGVRSVMRGAALFGVRQGGAVVLAVALRRVDGDGGATCWVTACGAVEGMGYIDALLPGVEQIAAEMGCVQLAFITARRGLVQKMTRAGYKQTAVIMRRGLPDGCR